MNFVRTGIVGTSESESNEGSDRRKENTFTDFGYARVEGLVVAAIGGRQQ